jgi:hypothetical protein
MNVDVLRLIAELFRIDGEFVAAEPFVGGHINDSYLLRFVERGGDKRYLLQRINSRVFPRPEEVVANIESVTAYISRRLAAEGHDDLDRRVLQLVRSRDGPSWHRTLAGDYWRVYHFIERTVARETVQTAEEAERAGLAFGEFQRLLSDYDGPQLHDTIPDFHNTPLRLAALEQAVADDACGRAREVQAEIEFVRAHRRPAGMLLDLHRAGQLPERVVHNDAKISNVLLDADTGEALCVTDLDTVMPGLSLYDFGDMVRSMTSLCSEDEPDSARATVELPLFEALVRGYLSAANVFLLPVERDHLIQAGLVITLEQGVRFLTDFLRGDTYYKTRRPGQNLDRCRTQLQLAASIEDNAEVMQDIVSKYAVARRR